MVLTIEKLRSTLILVSLFFSCWGSVIRTGSVPEPILLTSPQLLLWYLRSRDWMRPLPSGRWVSPLKVTTTLSFRE